MTDALSQDKENKFEDVEMAWKVARLLAFYRLLLACLLVFTFLYFPLYTQLGFSSPNLFLISSYAYLAYSVFSIVVIYRRNLSFHFQLCINAIVDIAFVLICIYSSGGLGSGLGMLLVVSIVTVGVFSSTRAAFAFAAGTALLLLFVHIYQVLKFEVPSSDFLEVGLLGAGLFVVAYIARLLAKQLNESQMLAAQQEVDLANLGQLNDYIIQHLDSGMLVVDDKLKVRLFNESAANLLSLTRGKNPLALKQVSEELFAQLSRWVSIDGYESKVFQAAGAIDVYPRFTQVGASNYSGDNSGILIFLDDMAVLDQKAQQLKMSALGRLTASIAHEIRNPLGALSHAAQLLEESENLDKADTRLLQIIRLQSARMNHIIENIMQLNRRDAVKQESIRLSEWVRTFVLEFSHMVNVDPSSINVSISPEDLTIQMDAGHLYQIMFNLCQNGILHGQSTKNVLLTIVGGESEHPHKQYLYVVDNGRGIDPAVVEQIFEPFFTTANKGTGLGLYIAKELVEANQASLSYVPNPKGGTCFQIMFKQNKSGA